MVLGEGIVQRFLTNTLSAYFENVDSDNLSVAVVRGDVSLNQVHLRKSVTQTLGFNSLRLVSGTVGSLRAKVPWTKFGTAPIVFELDNLFVLVESNEEELPALSPSEIEQKLKESMVEIIEAGSTELDLNAQQSTGWGGWLKSAGRLAKKLIDYIEIQIKIRNVHVRYTADLFTAGATFYSLSVSTTTQQAAPKILSLEKLAFYCNPLQDAVEDESGLSASAAAYQYVLEPVSGSVHMSFPSDHEIAIKGQFDSVQLQFSREQLNTTIWQELKRILMSTSAGQNPVSPKAVPTSPSSGSQIHISFVLGRAIVKSICLPATASSEGSVDFVGEQLHVSGDIGVDSEVKFRMRTFNVMNEKRRVLSSGVSGDTDFIQISVKTSERNKLSIPVDVQFRLGPVVLDFHPIVVGSLLSFLKSFPSSSAADAPRSGKVQLSFYWESMEVNWHQIVSERLFAKSAMSASFISLELLPSKEFIAKGELGDFSIDHVIDGEIVKPTLSLASPEAGYLFKFFVRSFDDTLATFPGYYTQVEFDLSAVRLVVVRSTLMRFWNYIFDGFLPAIVGDLTAGDRVRHSLPPTLVRQDSEESDFQSVSGDEEESRNFLFSPKVAPQTVEVNPQRRPYSLHVSLAALELVLPVSATTDESDPLKIELHKMTIKNQGAQGEIDVIDFDLEEVRIACLERSLVRGIQVKTQLFRETPTVRILTSFGPRINLNLDRHQYCRLCQVLDLNILANAGDGVVEDSFVPQVQDPLSPKSSLGEWLRFEFEFPNIRLSIDDEHSSEIAIADLGLKIVKFYRPKSQITVSCSEIGLTVNGSKSLGSVPSIQVEVDSELSGRSILVSVNQPVLTIDLGVLWGLRAYFFDEFSPYISPKPIRVITAVIPQPVTWETVLNVNLLNPKLLLPSSDVSGFSVGANVLSFHQNWTAIDQRLLRKFVVSNGAIHYSPDPSDDNLIALNLDFFYSISIERAESEIVKVNCEPVDVRLSFSQLKELRRSIDLQMGGLRNSSPPATTAASTSTTLQFSKIRRQTDITLSSIALLIVNDFAVLQNTPLFNLVVRNVDSAVSCVCAVGESENAVAVTRESLQISLEVSLAYFNKTSVSWEPLVEAINGSGGKFVRLDGGKSSITFGISERSSQASLKLSDGGIQVNVTEALIQSLVENWRHWSTRDTRVKHDSALDGGVVFSPYSVVNMTGEAEIEVLHNNLRFRVLNRKEEPLTGVSVPVGGQDTDHASHRVFVKIQAVAWTLSRVSVDKIGVCVFRVPGGCDVIARVSVTSDGRKVLTLESTVLVRNSFGSLLKLKLSNTENVEYEVELAVNEIVPIPILAVLNGNFRLSLLDNGSWSGAVSIPDIRARNESKLWQIKLEKSEFLYLSGEKRVVNFQDRQVVQLVITVYTPMRLRSTLPVLTDYQITAGGGFASAGTIGLNGQANISSVPLTGRLELSFSIFDGRCVSKESCQVWPPRTGELEQDVSSKQYFLPVELYSPNNLSGTPVIEVRLLYDESISAVRPPELTLHTGQWLVCVDVPPQLRFVYADGMDDWAAALGAIDPVTIETPRNEKSYAAPLHSRAKSVSAFLNKTRSESVLVDTIGSSGQITLDAYDESSRSRVKQDLAVRVSSVPSGVVRDLPVKITTVSPKYVVVNTMNSAIRIREFGNGKAQGILAGSGEQIAFRWWTVTADPVDGRDVVNRALQIRTDQTDEWSDRIKVAEIGESVVGGIENVRCEIRIYHGGFFIVISEGETTGETSATTAVNKPVVSSEVYQLVLPALAVSITGPVASRDVRRAEILLLDIKNLLLTVSHSPEANKLDLRMASIQLDDLRDEAKFPVVFGKSIPVKRSSASSTPPPETASAAEVFASWLTPQNTILNFESFFIKSADANLCIDFSLVSDLTAMFLACTTSDQRALEYPYKYVPVMEQLPVGSLRIWSFKELLIGPMKVNLSFNPGTGGLGGNYSVFHRAISSMAAVERSPIAFKALVLKKFRASRSNVLSVITEHYKFELYREMRTIMGSAEAFGNPVGLINSVSVGVSDLFHEPLSAIREMQGPEDMALVADKTAKGAKSFFRNTAFGVFNSFSKLAATSAQTLTILAEDDAFLNERKDFHNKNRPAHFGDGVMVGAASFGRGVMSGLSGLVTKPVEGLEQEGLAGFAKGAVKGVGGFFLKPMAGFFDFAKSTADGVVSSTKDAALDSNQSRLPRMLYSHDRVIRVVNSEHSLLRWYLGQLESMPPNFSYCAHVYDQQNGLLVACSSDHLVAADTNLRRLSLLVPLWRVLGITTDLDHLVLSINVQVPPSDAASLSSARGTSRIDLELSSVAIVKAVQQLVGNAMEI